MRELAGKVAVVTGSSRGIGRATVLELAERGADVVVNYFRHSDAGLATADEARARGVRALAVRAHAGRAEDIRLLFQTASDVLGGVDIVVPNAASGVFRPVLEIDDKAWDWTMNITTRSVLWCAQQAAPLMVSRGGGRIVTLGSPGVGRSLPNYAMTGLSKGALDSMTRYLAVELAPRGIIVNAVAPGIIATDAWKVYEATAPDGPAITADCIRRTPLGALATAEQVARVVALLCTSEGIVGQTIVVDNGFAAAW